MHFYGRDLIYYYLRYEKLISAFWDRHDSVEPVAKLRA